MCAADAEPTEDVADPGGGVSYPFLSALTVTPSTIVDLGRGGRDGDRVANPDASKNVGSDGRRLLSFGW